MHLPTHLIIEVLQLTGTDRHFMCLHLWPICCQLHLCQSCMMGCVTKAIPIQFIDVKKLKSYRIGLTSHIGPISHHITALVINAVGGEHTQAHTDTQTNA